MDNNNKDLYLFIFVKEKINQSSLYYQGTWNELIKNKIKNLTL